MAIRVFRKQSDNLGEALACPTKEFASHAGFAGVYRATTQEENGLFLILEDRFVLKCVSHLTEQGYGVSMLKLLIHRLLVSLLLERGGRVSLPGFSELLFAEGTRGRLRNAHNSVRPGYTPGTRYLSFCKQLDSPN